MDIKKFSSPVVLLMVTLLSGCYIEQESFDRPQNTEGFRPVYGSENEMSVSVLPSRTVNNPGKIYVYGKYLLVNEKKAGIHVFDNTNPMEPQKIAFIQLLGNTDMAMKDGILYADHLGNLVALSTHDFLSIEEKGRLPLKNWDKGLPPPAGYYFECVNPEKGIVVSWKKSQLTNPQCYAIQ